jgi:hypothetical protein
MIDAYLSNFLNTVGGLKPGLSMLYEIQHIDNISSLATHSEKKSWYTQAMSNTIRSRLMILLLT